MYVGWVMLIFLVYWCICNYMYIKFGGNINVNVLYVFSIWYIIKYFFVVFVSVILEFVG